MNKLLDKIIEDTYTKSDLMRRLGLLKEYTVRRLFSKSVNSLSLSQIDSEWITSLGEDFFKKFDIKSVYDTFTQLEVAAKEINPLTIFLSVDMSNDYIAQIGQRCRKLFARLPDRQGQRFLIDIKLDPGLIAGCSLVWGGVMKDYSIRAKIEENKQVILQSFKRSLK